MNEYIMFVIKVSSLYKIPLNGEFFFICNSHLQTWIVQSIIMAGKVEIIFLLSLYDHAHSSNYHFYDTLAKFWAILLTFSF